AVNLPVYAETSHSRINTRGSKAVEVKYSHKRYQKSKKYLVAQCKNKGEVKMKYIKRTLFLLVMGLGLMA
mgnify:CR=1